MSSTLAPRSIRRTILVAAFVASLVLVGAAYVFAMSIFERVIQEQARS